MTGFLRKCLFFSGVLQRILLFLSGILFENEWRNRDFKFLVASSMLNLNMKGGISYEKPCKNKRNIFSGHSFIV